jgi:hypothetical protein
MQKTLREINFSYSIPRQKDKLNDSYLNKEILFLTMNTPTKRGLIFSFAFIFILLNSFIVSAEEVIKKSKINLGLLFLLLPIFILIASIVLMRKTLKEKLWLKGGLIGIIFCISLLVSFFVCGQTCKVGANVEGCLGCLIFGIPLPGILILLSEPFNFVLNIALRRTLEWAVGIGFSIFVYFLAGALIGWIIQKIKSH